MTPTEEEVADTYHSLISVAHMHGQIYGTPCATITKVLRFWGRLGINEFKRIEEEEAMRQSSKEYHPNENS